MGMLVKYFHHLVHHIEFWKAINWISSHDSKKNPNGPLNNSSFPKKCVCCKFNILRTASPIGKSIALVWGATIITALGRLIGKGWVIFHPLKRKYNFQRKRMAAIDWTDKLLFERHIFIKIKYKWICFAQSIKSYS